MVDRGRRTNGSVAIRGDIVLGVDPDNGTGSESIDIDAEGLLISPGLIDLQVNGGYGIDLASDPEQMWALADRLPANGVTSFQPTIVSSPTKIYDRAMAALANRPADHLGAEPLGLHFEGPMLNPERAGAHNQINLRAPSIELIEQWSAQTGVSMVTLAPELPGATKIIEHLDAVGTVVAAGHSTASTAEGRAAIEAGVTMVTHLFNGMDPMHHRDPKLAGLALADRRLVVGIIADGIHVDPVMVAAAWAAKGMSGLVLVSDAVAALGLEATSIQLGDRAVTATEDGVRTPDGTLAGSALSLDAAVRNLMDFTGCWVEEAFCTVTATPAAVLNLSDRGVVAPGTKADLALFDDELDVAITVCRGRVVYVADKHRDRISEELTGSLAHG